jgi:hypothetical protein
MCMEGIEHNPVVYELMSEMAFRSEKVQVLVIIHFYILLNNCCFRAGLPFNTFFGQYLKYGRVQKFFKDSHVLY